PQHAVDSSRAFLYQFVEEHECLPIAGVLSFFYFLFSIFHLLRALKKSRSLAPAILTFLLTAPLALTTPLLMSPVFSSVTRRSFPAKGNCKSAKARFAQALPPFCLAAEISMTQFLQAGIRKMAMEK